jgi:hypothetical protein
MLISLVPLNQLFHRSTTLRSLMAALPSSVWSICSAAALPGWRLRVDRLGGLLLEAP